MKIWLEVDVRGLDGSEVDQTDLDDFVRTLSKDLSGEYYSWRVEMDVSDDPGEQYNQGYDSGFSGGMYACEAQHGEG